MNTARLNHGKAWLDHWLATWRDLPALTNSHPMADAVIEPVDGRRVDEELPATPGEQVA
jgi:hypothetical protein